MPHDIYFKTLYTLVEDRLEGRRDAELLWEAYLRLPDDTAVESHVYKRLHDLMGQLTYARYALFDYVLPQRQHEPRYQELKRAGAALNMVFEGERKCSSPIRRLTNYCPFLTISRVWIRS